MNTVKIKKINESYIQISAPQDIREALSNYFSIFVPNYKFHQKFKRGIWDGKIRLFSKFNGRLYIGLTKNAIDFIQDTLKVKVEIIKSRDNHPKITLNQVNEFLDNWKHPSLAIREYQKEIVQHGLTNKKIINVCPTGSGKSLGIYLIIKYLKENVFIENTDKILLVVPYIHLTTQMYGDFISYDLHYNNIRNNLHVIHKGIPKNDEKGIYISTWQSIYTEPPAYFQKFKTVIVDEAHMAKGQSLTKILEKSIKAQYRIGLTGTLDDWLTNKIILKGILGPVKLITTTRSLIEQGFLAPLNIFNIKMIYDDIEKQLNSSLTYHDELNFILNHPKRNKKIIEIASKLKGNSLILFTRRKHGKMLFESLKEKGKDVYYVDGTVEKEEREELRSKMENSDNMIIVGSYGIYSVGVNIKKLHNIILSSPTKSKIRTLQSIGRGLRVHKDKDVVKIIDIVDDLTYEYINKRRRKSTKQNHAYRHYLQRMKYYNKEQFNINNIKVVL